MLLSNACSMPEARSDLDIQGHRGCRGIYPENSIAGMVKALEMGVQTLEMDVVITGDRQVILSHEPYMSHEICSDSTEQEISASDERTYNIYKMSYAEVRKFDCGSKVHPRFPGQIKAVTRKPLLEDVIAVCEAHQSESGNSHFYNIEIKSRGEWDNVYHPSIPEYAALVIDVVQRKGVFDRTIIQSFDPRALEYVHANYPGVKTAYLVEGSEAYTDRLRDLTFKPDIYSCDWKLLNAEIIADLQEKQIDVIPWTVNEVADMKKLINWGVNGIITDYPDRLVKVLKS